VVTLIISDKLWLKKNLTIKPGGNTEQLSATPLLDSILNRGLTLMVMDISMSIPMPEAEEAKKRLLIKLKEGRLSQKDIETELKDLPNDTMEITKTHLVDIIRRNLYTYNHDIKKLPVEDFSNN
jgi:hypothetical protein